MKKATSEPLLLDVNVLLALAWPNHQFHAQARARLLRVEQWASCALTQLAFVRLYMNPTAVGTRRPMDEALDTLANMVERKGHVYWGDLPDMNAAQAEGAFARVMGHRQVNDAYLLELARRRGGRLLTFDQRLAALGAPGVAEVLAP